MRSLAGRRDAALDDVQNPRQPRHDRPAGRLVRHRRHRLLGGFGRLLQPEGRAGHDGRDSAGAGSYTDLGAFLHDAGAAGLPVYGTFLEGENIYGTALTEEGVVVMGNEGRGISQAAARRIATSSSSADSLPDRPPRVRSRSTWRWPRASYARNSGVGQGMGEGGQRVETLSCRLDKAFTAAESNRKNGEAAASRVLYTVLAPQIVAAAPACSRSSTPGAAPTRATTSSRATPVGASARLQVRQRGLHHVTGARRGLHDDHGAPLVPPRHVGVSLPYLIEKEGRTTLMPGANLTSYGAVRDIEKWPARPPRTQTRRHQLRRIQPLHNRSDAQGVDTLHTLAKPRRAVVFRKAVTNGHRTLQINSSSRRWAPCSTAANRAARTSAAGSTWRGSSPNARSKRSSTPWTAASDNARRGGQPFQGLFLHYDDYAHSWAEGIYASLLGQTDRRRDQAGRNRDAPHDRRRPRHCSLDMARQLRSGDDGAKYATITRSGD